jgi:hypothetical protein
MADVTADDAADSGKWLAENPSSVPDYPVNLIGISRDPVYLSLFEQLVRQWVDGFSCLIDLSRLDGVTIAADYGAALSDLDRGYETKGTLTATSDQATGVAMTPCVIRAGVLKSHIGSF